MSKELMSLAKAECCNYAASGPFNLKDYCFMEPKPTEHKCRIFCGVPCNWFQKAVLPLKPDYIGFYKALMEKENPAPDENIKHCACGAVFNARSNRQTECPECHKKRVREQTRKRVRNLRMDRVKKGGRLHEIDAQA